jgi:hypothetical protein
MMIGFYNVPGGQYSRLLYTNIESTIVLCCMRFFCRSSYGL